MFQENFEQLFIDELGKGINLFLGAGFSRLPDNKGNMFPDAKELCDEICDRFSIDDVFRDDLYAASEMVPKVEYQNYLRNRFTIKNGFNSKYLLLDKLNIMSIITTNIDNLIKVVFNDPQTNHYVNDISTYGVVRQDEFGIEYIALNGDVSIDTSYLYFGKFDLAVVENENNDLYSIAKYRLKDNPVLFWGYSFSDTGVQKLVKYLLDKNKHPNIWVQCLKEDKKQIKFFESLGCKVIIASTEELFDWISNNVISIVNSTDKPIIPEDRKFNRYRLPNPYSIATYDKEDYYRLGVTNWYSIYNNHAYETSLVDEIWSLSLVNKNVILVGSQFSGKTTALMQCAAKRNSNNVFFFEGDTSADTAQFFLRNNDTDKIVVFLKDAHKDISTFCLFANSPNVRLIATADKYSFDNVKHILVRNNIECYEKYIDSIDINTARRIYNFLPSSIIRPNFTYRENKNEEYSYLELLGQNVKDFATYDSVVKLLENIIIINNQQYGDEILLVALTVYLEQHGSLMSTDLFFSFFGFSNYHKQIVPLRDKVKGLLSDVTDVNVDQDYFSIRSKFFLKFAHNAFTSHQELRPVYKYVITKFIKEVYKGNVFRYDLFKKRAYDSRLFFKVFSDDISLNDKNARGMEAIELYDIIYSYDESPYTLQQKALFLSLILRSKEAFSVIDDALSILPNNFSIKNSKAEIIFNANKGVNSTQAEGQLNNAIEILNECRKNDKKQVYHAILYARIVLHLFEKYDNIDESYLPTAIEWLESIDNPDKSIIHLLNKLKDLKI